MKTPDPFNHGSTETLNSHVMPDEQQRAVIAVLRRHRGDPATRDLMLDAFGLTNVAEEMLRARRAERGLSAPLRLVKPVPRPSPQEVPADVLVALTDPRDRRLRPQQRDAIAKARRVLAEATTEELPEIDGKPRCGNRLHYRTKTNTKRRVDGAKQCLDCLAVSAARSVLRNYGLLPVPGEGEIKNPAPTLGNAPLGAPSERQGRAIDISSHAHQPQGELNHG